MKKAVKEAVVEVEEIEEADDDVEGVEIDDIIAEERKLKVKLI